MKQRETKNYRAEVKAAGEGQGLAKGEFMAVVSVFGNVDMGGDRVVKGAFAKSIADMQNKGEVLPIIWSHEWDNPMAHIGYADPKDMQETDEGLQIKGVLDVDRPFAEQVHHLMTSGRVKEFSFGYFVNESEVVTDPDGKEVRQLTDVEIFEAGPTLKGMNPDTRLLQAASALRDAADADAKAGRVLSAKNESLIAEARDALNAVLATLGEKAAEPAGKAVAENKAISVPEYVAENAARGLAYYEDGYGGDGLVDATIRAARDMAAGSVSEEKVRKIGPWIARHIVDLDAPQNSDRNDPGYPGAGLVAMLLWGAGPDVEGARRTQAWAEQESARLDEAKSETPTEVEAPEETTSGDTDSTIDTERLLTLLVKPKN